MIALAVLGAMIAVGLVARRRWMIVTVRGHSMAPTLRDGERLIARRWSPAAVPVTGELIVFLPDALGYRIKRVAGVAGDPVPAWLAARDGERIPAGHVPAGHVPAGHVPAGHVIVRGDNPRSEGSRELGYIALDAIIARIVHRGARRAG